MKNKYLNKNKKGFPYVFNLPNTCINLEIKNKCDTEKIINDLKFYIDFFEFEKEELFKLKLIK